MPRYLIICLSSLLCIILSSTEANAEQPNVLFIAVDDLRVELGCYGSPHVLSPNIDQLAAEGVQFEKAYCQQTVCNPSRASVMTGMRPDTLRVWDLPTHFRQNIPDAVTIPQLFKKNGYHAQCIGKIFHNWRQDDWKGDPASWSVPSVLHYNNHGHDRPEVEGDVPPNLASGKNRRECRDVPDNAYFDGRVAEQAISTLRSISKESKPFFLAVGFWKPHTPFNAPKKYWDLYDRDQIPVPDRVSPPVDVPEIALTDARYREAVNSPDQREMHHAHLAAISYLDAQVGKVLQELSDLKLKDSTIIVFWSDHGLHLGEHGLTRKTTAFELDAHIPLIISAPEHRTGQKTDAIVELVDLYPTLAELCGMQPPESIEGTSLVPVLNNPESRVKKVGLTQTPRPNYLKGKMPEVMGYSIRNPRYRYTEWRDFKSGLPLARELYDHETDPGETRNVSVNPQYAQQVSMMSELLSEKLGDHEQTRSISDLESTPMLDLTTTGKDPAKINFKQLPKIPLDHAMISDVRDRGGNWVHQHAYLAHFNGCYWAMWSDGPGKRHSKLTPEQHRNVVPGHDLADTRVSYATSKDGLTWTEPASLSGPPRKEGFGWIARGLWARDGKLLALASHFDAPGYAGLGLSLEAFAWNEEKQKWDDYGTVRDDTLNNFPPKRLPTGQYMMTRRDYNRQVSVLIGGQKAFDQWEVRPLASYDGNGRPEEPYWYILPDGKTLCGLIRDNGRSGRLLRTFSTDNGQTWTPIRKTNFPDATSKFFVLKTSRGYYAMVSNSNPKRRDPLTLAISPDGLTFTHLFELVGGRHVDYPHIIEQDGHLLIAFSGAKQTMEVVRVSLDEIDSVVKKSSQGEDK